MYRFVHHTAELEVGLEAETAQGVLLEELPTSRFHGHELRPELESRGIVVPSPSAKGLAEEAPFANKDVDRVVRIVERAGLAQRVARLVPLGVVKG